MHLFSRVRISKYVGITMVAIYGSNQLYREIFGVKSKAKVLAAETTPVAENGSTHSEPTDNDMQLRSVQIFFRHGARTPLRHLESQVAEVSYDSAVLIRDLPYTSIPVLVQAVDGQDRPPAMYQRKLNRLQFQGGCFAGQLTVLGKDQTYCLGRRLRNRYIETLHLVDSFSKDQVFIRSTNVDRTIESLQCVLAGMFQDLRPDNKEPVIIPVSHPTHEILVPNPRNCPGLSQMEKKVAEVCPTIPAVQAATDTINQIIGNEGELNMMNWRDHIQARRVHGLRIPEFMETHEESINAAAVQAFEAYTSGLPQNREDVLRFSTGPLLQTIHDNMTETTKNDSSPRVYLYSVHDSTLVPLLHGIQSFDGIWPPYAADVIFELWEDKSHQHWVHIKYCDKSVIPKGHSRPLLTLEEFSKLIQPVAISFDSYIHHCKDVHALTKALKKADLSAVYQEEDEDEDKSLARKGL